MSDTGELTTRELLERMDRRDEMILQMIRDNRKESFQMIRELAELNKTALQILNGHGNRLSALEEDRRSDQTP